MSEVQCLPTFITKSFHRGFTSEWLKKDAVAIHARKPSNVDELRQFCKETWAKVLHRDVKPWDDLCCDFVLYI